MKLSFTEKLIFLSNYFQLLSSEKQKSPHRKSESILIYTEVQQGSEAVI